MIVEAVQEDHDILSKITKASKAFWEYSKEQMEVWDQELTITKKYIEENIVYKLLMENKIVGYYSLEIISSGKIKLENLFILPEFIGKGFGKMLLNHALELAKKKNFTEMILNADPHATEFYIKNGFEIIGQKKTSIKDRYLPIMHMNLFG